MIGPDVSILTYQGRHRVGRKMMRVNYKRTRVSYVWHMPRHSLTDFAPRWVLVIYFLSLGEAIGLTIYFHADLVDPESASMQSAYVEARSNVATFVVEDECGADKPRTAKADCRREAHNGMQVQKRQEHVWIIRHVESRSATGEGRK
jgi:hypothetical protein